MVREVTDSETKATLKAINERQGKWGDIDAACGQLAAKEAGPVASK